MAKQGWITTPKGKRWQNSDGRLSYMPPASAGWGAIQTTPAPNALLGAVDALNRGGIGITSAARAEYLTQQPSPLTPADLGRYARGDQQVKIKATAEPAPIDPLRVAPGLGAPDAYGDPAARARESEQRRMMQQYASKEYWNTEQGKAMKDLALQSEYKGDNLADYYAAQRAVGEGSIDEIIQGMGYTGAMADWARANKGMALREYLKRFPGGQPTTANGELAAPTIDQVKPTVGEQALMNAKVALYDGAPVAPGVTIGNEPGAVAGVNRGKMAELQAIVPQAKSTGAGEGAFKMQPQSAATTGFQLPAGAVGEFNMPVGAQDFTQLVNEKIWRNRNELAGLPTVGGYQSKNYR